MTRIEGKEREVMGHKKSNHEELYESRRSQCWVDKYQPKLLEDVKHQDEAVQKLRKTLKLTKDHIYLYGKRGIGKTSTALAFARQIFKSPKLYESRVLHTCSLSPKDTPENATQRKKSLCLTPLNTLLTSITKFVEVGSSKHDRCPPFRLIIIDRAQYLDVDYQKALIPAIEEASSRNVRFIFKCDCMYTCRCIDKDKRLFGPLTVICASIGFKSLPDEYVEKRLLEICHKEELTAAPEVLSTICYNANGSLGWAITYLQRAARSFRPTIYLEDLRQISNGTLIPREEIEILQRAARSFRPTIHEDDLIQAINGALIPREDIEALIDACKLNKFKLVMNTINVIFAKEICIPMYLSQLYDVVVEAKDITPPGKDEICDCLVEADEKLRKDGNGQLHMLNVAGTLMVVLLKIPNKHVERFWLEWTNCYPKEWDVMLGLGSDLSFRGPTFSW